MWNIKAMVGLVIIAGLAFIVFIMGVQVQAPAYSLDTVVNDESFYPEGPLWMNKALYYTEYSKHRVMRWNGKENTVLWEQRGCGPSALVDTGDNTMLVTCYDSNSLVEIDTEGRSLRTIDKNLDGIPFNGPNDFVKDEKGGMYFSASGTFDAKAAPTGKIYYIRPEGEIILVANGLHYPNGLALVQDGKELLVNEHLSKKISRFTVAKTGLLSNYNTFLNLASIMDGSRLSGEYTGPDGLKADDHERLFVCVYGAAAVLVTDLSGKMIGEIDVPEPYVTNINFADSCDTVFITASTDALNAPYPGKVFRYTTSREGENE